MQKYNKTVAQILQEMSIDRAKEVAAKLGDEAKEKGLEHMGHGVYGKNGKPEFRSNLEKGKLIKLTPDEIKDYMKKKSGDTDGDDEPKKDSPDTDKPKQDAPSKDTDSGPKVTSPKTDTGQLLQNPPHDSLPDKEQIGTDMRTVMGDRQPKVSYTQNGETIIHFRLKPVTYGPNEMAYSDVLSILEDDYGLVEGEDFVIDEISKEVDGEDMPSEIMVNIRRDPSASDSVEDEEAYDRERAQLARRGLFYRADSYNYVNEATVSVFDISYDDVPKSKLTQAARKFKIKMKKLPKNKVSFGGDDAIEFTGDEKNLLKFTKQQFGTTARNIRDLKKELEETAYPQISHSLIESIRNVVSEDPVQKAQDKLDKAKKIADLKKQIDDIRGEEALDKEDEPAVKKLVKNLRKGSKTHAKQADELEKDLKDNYEPLEEFKSMVATFPDKRKKLEASQALRIFGVKLGIKTDKLNDKQFRISGKDKDMNMYAKDLKNFYGAQIKAESIEEATVTIKSYDTKTGLDRQAEKQMNAVAQRAGAKVKKSGNNVYKVTGDGKQLSKFMANIDQIDGSFMTEESEFINEFTSAQIKRLKKEYEPLRGVHHTELQPARFTQLSKMMQRMGKPQLQALVKADIPVLSSAAKASLVVNHGMKFSSIKEELIPYLEVFPLDENRKSKFKSVAPEVINRIQKMMKGNREEKDSIANMLNYMMPPEVVDMVRDKLKITAKRGKIRF